MVSITEQIESGRLVCPLTHQQLVIKGEFLETQDGLHRYPFRNGVPVLFTDLKRQKAYLDDRDGQMQREYADPPPRSRRVFCSS